MPVPSYPAASEAKHEEGFLPSRDSLRLYWQRYTPPTPRATVAVLPGGGDHGGRYAGLTAALVRAGFETALVDFRGHSQGGLIAATWGLTPSRGVAGFVLSSPYFRLKLEPPRLKVLGARLVGTVIPWLPISTGLRVEDLSSDPEMQRWTDADPLYGRATTPRWFVESQRAQREVLGGAARFAYPVLVMAGTADAIADPAAEREFFDAARSADKEFRSYPGFRHELFNERERDRPIGDAVAWLLARA